MSNYHPFLHNRYLAYLKCFKVTAPTLHPLVWQHLCVCVCFCVKTSTSSSFFSSLFHRQLISNVFTETTNCIILMFSGCSTERVYGTCETSSLVRLAFPAPANHNVFIHLRMSLQLSFAHIHQEIAVLSHISSFTHMFPRQLIASCLYLSIKPSECLAPSLHKPVPWKP